MEYSAINFEPLTEKRQHPVQENIAILGALITFIICVVALGMFLYAVIVDREVYPLRAVVAFLSLLIASGCLWWSDKVGHKSMGPRLFIEANGFKPEDATTDWQQIGSQMVALSGRLQHKKLQPRDFTVANSFSGQVGEQSFQAFELIKTTEDVLDAKKAVESRPYMLIMSFVLDRDLPHLYISNRKLGEGANTAIGFFEEGWLLRQPGSFKAINKDLNNYAIYAPEKLEVEALTLLSPTVLEVIAAAGPGADIEILHGQLVIYQYIGSMEGRPQAYRTAFGLASQLLPAMQRNLKTLRYDAQGRLSASAKGIYYDDRTPSKR